MDQIAETIEAPTVDLVDLTANVVSAYVSKNSVRPNDMPDLLATVHAALTGLGQSGTTEAPATQKLTPAQIRKSVTPDALISFIDGKPYKTLKRHLTGNGMTPEEYRARFGLPRDYPVTAASYSAMRAEFARSSGLGQKRQAAWMALEHAATAAEKPKRGRPRKTKDATEA